MMLGKGQIGFLLPQKHRILKPKSKAVHTTTSKKLRLTIFYLMRKLTIKL